MSEQDEISDQVEKRRSALADKLLELEKALCTECELPFGDSTDDFLSSCELARSLFGKASVDFLERKTLDDLVAITRKSAQTLSSFFQKRENICIDCETCEDFSSFYISLGDHPFIITSITECVRDFGVKILSLNHPILIDDGYRVSFSYLETSPLSKEQSEVLRRRIQRTLEHVMLATDEYTSILVRAETLARVLQSSKSSGPFPQSDKKEVSSLIKWLTEGGFIFLGSAEWQSPSETELSKKPSSSSGVFKADESYSSALVDEVRNDVYSLLSEVQPVLVTRLRSQSLVHRRTRMMNIVIPQYASDGTLHAIHSFAGLLTSRALAQESSSVPFIRRKLKKILRLEDAIENSHDYKRIVDIVDSMPKDEALGLDLDDLRELIHTILAVQNRDDTTVSVRFDDAKHSATVLIVLPRDRFNTEVRNRLQEHIESVFGSPPGSSEYYLDLSAKPHARFYFHIAMSGSTKPPIDVSKLKLDIVALTRTWRDNLEERISQSALFTDISHIWYRYADAFGEDYQASYSIEDCVQDISLIETLTDERTVQVGFSHTVSHQPNSMFLSVYKRGTGLTLSQALPILENIGLEVISENCFNIRPAGAHEIYLHRFLVQPHSDEYYDTSAFDTELADNVRQIFDGTAENDELNSLLVTAKLSVKQIFLLRAYCSLHWQISKGVSRTSVYKTLASVPSAAAQLWQMFDMCFNPGLTSPISSRTKRFYSSLKNFEDGLREISDISKDRILRNLSQMLRYTCRTNYFTDTDCLALKIRSEHVECMPSPKPMYDTFIRSLSMEGVHLRSSQIARGGLRWSERNEDYRSEVLGLMKTQKIKNAVIIPTGAKGGFVVRDLSRDAKVARSQVESTYKTFIRALLSICDNRVGDSVVHPENVIVYDGEDPYFVVAADKGTATFSDIANDIATNEYDYWLGDAFASGGSQGYDHKLYGITARGAWESVKRHFKNLNLDYHQKTFTAVGIGDMSGDVFGNGLLLSDKVRLLAAFNHKHIFIDPDPDADSSFQERKRLFETPNTAWSDYSLECISKGGGVFGRFDKEIHINDEIRHALAIPDEIPDAVNGEELVRLILQANVDLLWNGGIGTYVKASSENNADAHDGTNDRVRIDANELRARVVGEGGNLGFTQKGRIEYARNGGRIHTDAIDNSAGVDLSDHEVNLKILFAELIRTGKLTSEERDTLLPSIADEVIALVLRNNWDHSLRITLAFESSQRRMGYFRSLIREISRNGYINRRLEALPSDEELLERAEKKQGLTAPELAVCLAGVKLWIKDVLLGSDLPKEPLLHEYLFEYFPKTLSEKYRQDLLEHPLSENIIATQISNRIVNSTGISYVHRMCLNHSSSPAAVAQCAIACEFILQTEEIRRELAEILDNPSHQREFIQLTRETNEAVRDAASWLLSYHSNELKLGKIVERYKPTFDTLLDHAEDFFIGQDRDLYDIRLQCYKRLQLSERTATALALFPKTISLFEMMWTSKKSQRPVQQVAHVFFTLVHKLGLPPVMAMEEMVEPEDKWENELLLNTFDDIRMTLSSLTTQLLEQDISDDTQIGEIVRNSDSFEPLTQTIDEIREKTPSVAALSIIAKQLRMFQLM